MRREGNLMPRIADPENIRLAFWKAAKGKGGKPDVEAFQGRLQEEIQYISEALLSGSYRWGGFHRFLIHDPKERWICAAPFRDRVVHHAILNVCEPAFERYQIHDSYACRKGKGLVACLDRASTYTRRHEWYLKLDVRKYFDSIPHERLKMRLARRFKDKELLRLLDTLIDGYATSPGRGLPIGNLTSQFFANDFLAELDHLIREALRVPGYVRYMDDLVLWQDDPVALRETRDSLAQAATNMGLAWKTICLNRCRQGVGMLGFRVFPDRRILLPRSRRRFRGKVKAAWEDFASGQIDQAELGIRALALCAFTRHAEAHGFRRRVLTELGCGP